MAVTLVPGLSCAITALWEFAGVEVDIVFYSFQCMEILDKRKNIFTIFTNTQIMDRMFGSGSRISDVSTRTTMVHWCQVYLVLLGITVSHWVSLPAPALTDSHHGQMTPIIMLQSHDSQQITRTLSMEIEYR